MSIFNPWILLGVVSALAVSFFSGYKVRGDYEKAKMHDAVVAYAKAYEAETERVNLVSEQAEKDLSALRTRSRNREAQLKKELSNAKTYTTCMLPESGRMLYNAAVRDAHNAASGEPVKPMPDAGSPGVSGNNGRHNEGVSQ